MLFDLRLCNKCTGEFDPSANKGFGKVDEKGARQ
jgi:hypothetical protein